jgi:hypothetical protein
MATEEQLASWRWRVSNLYQIADEKGRVVPFRPNPEQLRFMAEMHTLNLILKARQLGFSTLIEIMGLDTCLFHPNTEMGVIAQDLDTAKSIFQLKVRDVYERLPAELKNAVSATQDAAQQMSFSNGSRIRVGTSLRGGTYQFLHVSELGKIAAKYPEKAREIKSGALNTVHAGQHIFIESTAEGQGGLLHELCEEALDRDAQGIEPSELEFKLYFAPWWRDRRYVLTGKRTIAPKYAAYFEELEKQHGIQLHDAQKLWYAQKAAQQKEDMRREFPSYPEEAFDAPIEGAYYTAELTRAQDQRRIGEYPYDPKLGQVYTFWDLGRSDLMTIWLGQRIGPSRWRWIDYIEDQDKSFPYYARILKEKAQERGWTYGQHFLPHDGGRKGLESDNSNKTVLENNGIFPCVSVQRTKDLSGPDLTSSINLVKQFIEISEFDRTNCATGLKHLRNYRREWDDNLAIWKPKPFHNQASDGADGFRTAAEADYQGLLDDIYYNQRERDAEYERQRYEVRNSPTGY